MDNKAFRKWCWNATWLIQYTPDREEVAAELYEHLLDHYEDLIAQGYSEEEAVAKALEAMGDASEIAGPLGQLHSPFWGLLTRRLAIAMAILLCITLVSFCFYVGDLRFGNPSPRDFNVFSEESYGGNTGRTLLHMSEHEISASLDGSRFTVTDAAVFTETINGTESTRLYLRVQQRTTMPWLEHERYYYPLTCYYLEDFYARDSLGNHYPSFMECGWSGIGLVHHGAQTGLFTYTYECWINDYQGADGDWLELRYDRDGRDFCLRIRLNGGGEE